MTVDVASLALRVDALEVNKASEALKRLEKTGGDAEATLGGATKSIAAGFGRITAAAAIAYGAVQTIGGASREFLAFDKSLAMIGTQIDGNTDKIKEFEVASRNLATSFGTKLTDQSAAFYEVLSAGINDTTEATALLTEANKLAIGGNATLASTVDGLTSVMKVYGDKVKSVEDISDSFFTASLAGKISIEELASGLGRVSPLADAVGISFDELGASVAALTLGGTTAREAITGVRAVLASVVKPSSEAADEAERIGLEFNAAAIKSKGFVGFLEDVKQKTGGSQESLALLFGGVEALIPIIAFANKAGVEFGKIMEQMSEKTGLAQRSFEQMANSDSAKIDRLFAAINSAAVTLGGTLAGVLVPAAELAANALRKLFATENLTGIQLQEKKIQDLTDKLERMKGINNILPFDNFIYNKKDLDATEQALENAKSDLVQLKKLKDDLAKPVAGPEESPLVPNNPPKKTSGGGGSGKKDEISEGERFIKSLQDQAREAGVTGLALTELRAKHLGVAEGAAPAIQKLREVEFAMVAQRDSASQYARDLERVKGMTLEVATAEEVFIAKQNELNRLLSKGLLDPQTYFRQLEKAGEAMNTVGDNGLDKFRQLEFAIQGWGRAASDTLVEFAVGGKASFSDFAESVLKDILRMYIQMQLITPLLQSLPGLNFGGTGGGAGSSTSAASNVFSGLFKGGRATGGPVAPNSLYEVNEGGIPELLRMGNKQFLLTGNRAGSVSAPTPGGSSGGGSRNVVVNLIEAPGKGGESKQRETNNGLEIDVMVDQLVAKKQAQRGSASNKGLQQNFGLRENLVMR